MDKHKLSIAIFLICLVFIPTLVFAHPGRTDSYGCHTCRTNCSKWGLSMGEYHCHRTKTLPQPKEPIKSHFSETGGYTTPAPEYKQSSLNIPKSTDNIKMQTNESWIKKLLRFLFN